MEVIDPDRLYRLARPRDHHNITKWRDCGSAIAVYRFKHSRAFMEVPEKRGRFDIQPTVKLFDRGNDGYLEAVCFPEGFDPHGLEEEERSCAC